MNKEFRRLLTEKLKDFTYISESDAPFDVASHGAVSEIDVNAFFAAQRAMNPDADFEGLKGFILANTKRGRTVLKIQFSQVEYLYILRCKDLSG